MQSQHGVTIVSQMQTHSDRQLRDGVMKQTYLDVLTLMSQTCVCVCLSQSNKGDSETLHPLVIYATKKVLCNVVFSGNWGVLRSN